ncbi:T9SS type A sorting domain-containing protein [bacterium]|nr:T9SS type A sorting domain-containing protein [bacterium]MBU1983522.1 T9SS type A sorting domain-containing protein [bacterium]
MSRKLLIAFATLLCLALAANAPAQVILNEVYYDNPGAENADVLFTELWGPPGTSLSGWTLVGTNGNNGTEYRTVTLSGTIPADGYFVIGNTASVPNVDLVLNVGTTAGVDWQNGGYQSTPDCDGVDLRNASGTTVDHLCYGECENPGNCTGEGGSNAPDYDPPASGPAKSIGRVPDHQDTDNNGADWMLLDPPSPGTPNSGSPCDPQYVTLSDVRENDGNGVPVLDGVFVVVQGIVNVDNYTLDSLTESSFYIQDDDAGCNVFRGNVPVGIMEGDCVEVSGWVGQYNGLTELLSSGSGNCVFSVEVIGSVDTVEPTLVTGASYFESFEGMLVRMNGVSIISGTWPGEGQYANLTITDGNGTITLRIDSDTDVDGSPAPPATFDVMGIVTQFDNTSPYTDGYQITPRYPSDILIPDAVGDEPTTVTVRDFRLLESYPNPFNSSVQIRFEVGAVRELSLSVFDVLGREVLSEKLTSLTPGAHDYTWSPTGATGLYLLRLEGAGKVETGKLLYLR